MIRWFFLCWLWQLPLQAQYILDAQQVALITYTDENDINTSYHFYKQTGRDAFVEMYLNLGVLPPEKKGDEFLQISWKYDSRVLSLKQIKKEEGLLLYPKDLPVSSYTDFLGKMYGNYASSDKIREIFHLLNPFQVLRYIVKYNQRRYFHGDNIAYADDDHYLWRATYERFLTPVVLKFSQGKEGYLLLGDVRTNFYVLLLPHKRQSLRIGEKKILQPKTMSFQSHLGELYSEGYSYNEKFFQVKEENGQYTLMDRFSQRLLPEHYDTLVWEKGFILGQRAGRTQVYNAHLERLDKGEVKDAHVLPAQVEVLTEKEAFYMDERGQRVPLYRYQGFLECASGEAMYQYIVTKDTLQERIRPCIKVLAYTSDGFQSIDDTFFLMDRSNVPFAKPAEKEELSLLSEPPQGHNPTPVLVRVRKGGKEGVFLYKIPAYFVYEKDEDITEEALRNYRSLKGEEIVACLYDRVVQDENGIIFLHQGGKIFVHGDPTHTAYDSIHAVTKSFYKYTKNGKEGYISVNSSQ